MILADLTPGPDTYTHHVMMTETTEKIGRPTVVRLMCTQCLNRFPYPNPYKDGASPVCDARPVDQNAAPIVDGRMIG